MRSIRWGMIGCGDVAEVKSGPAFQKAEDSTLLAVTRRNRAKAEDFASRHGVPRVHADADALIGDPEIDAVYVATTPSSHCDLALRVAAAKKPCLVEKPMAVSHAECLCMIAAFRAAGAPLWVAYYRRALPRFLKVRELLAQGAIGRVTSVHVDIREPLAEGDRAKIWRFDPAIAGAGLFLDLASHCFDLLEFLIGPIATVSGVAVNTGRAYPAEDATGAVFRFETDALGTGTWNFHADRTFDCLTVTGSRGRLNSPVFRDDDVVINASDGTRTVYPIRNPPHVHQPLVQTAVDELLGRGRCPSTGESGARASWAMDGCLANYYGRKPAPQRLKE